MASKVCPHAARRSERSDANNTIAFHKYALTVSYLPTYHDDHKKFRVTNRERGELIQRAVNYLETVHNLCIVNEKYEVGTNDTLHLHCVALSRVRVYPYPKYKGFRLHFKKLTNPKGWDDYCKKEDTWAYKQKITEKYFLNPNHFQFQNI